MIDLDKNLALINKRTKSSVIRKLLKLTNRPNIISFAGGLPDPNIFPSEIIEEISCSVLKKQSRVALQYCATDGLSELKEEIIKLLERMENISIKPENLLITTSSQQGLDLVGKAFIDPMDPVFVELPSYIGGLQVFSSYGAKLIGIPTDSDGISIDYLEEKLHYLSRENNHYKFIYIVPDFQNPSGVTTSQQRREQLCKLSEKYKLYIFEDSPYRQLRFEGNAPEMLYKINPNGNVISISTFSKTFAPGFRLGFVIANEEIISKLSILKQSIDLCSSSFNQLILTEFLKQNYYDEHIKNIVKVYGKKRDIMLNALSRYMPNKDNIHWIIPQGGLFLWLKLPEHIDTEQMFNHAIKENVAYVIGSAFHCDNTGHNTMRLNFSFPSEPEIEEGIKRLAKVTEKYL